MSCEISPYPVLAVQSRSDVVFCPRAGDTGLRNPVHVSGVCVCGYDRVLEHPPLRSISGGNIIRANCSVGVHPDGISFPGGLYRPGLRGGRLFVVIMPHILWWLWLLQAVKSATTWKGKDVLCYMHIHTQSLAYSVMNVPSCTTPQSTSLPGQARKYDWLSEPSMKQCQRHVLIAVSFVYECALVSDHRPQPSMHGTHRSALQPAATHDVQRPRRGWPGLRAAPGP